MASSGSDAGEDWTLESLKVYTDRRFDALAQQFADLSTLLDERYATQTVAVQAAFVAQQVAMQTALDAAKEAVTKAEVASEKRFESVNEFRGQLADQATSFLTKAEYAAEHRHIEDSVTSMEKRLNIMDGRSGGLGASWSYLLGAAGLVASVLAIWLVTKR